MSDRIKSLAARFYTDPEVFRIECDGLLVGTWRFGCDTADLVQTGDFVTFEVGCESLIVIRGRDDVICVFYNVCQRRAHQLARGTGAELVEWVPHWQPLRPLEWIEIPEKCNWKVSVENYSQCYHCALNHPAFASGVVKP